MEIALCLSLLGSLYINDAVDECKMQKKDEFVRGNQKELCHQYSYAGRDFSSSNGCNEWDLKSVKMFLEDTVRWIAYYSKTELTQEGLYIPQSDLRLAAWEDEGAYRYKCYYKETPVASIDELRQYPIDSILILKSLESPAEKYAISEVERVVGHRLPVVYGYNSFPVYDTRNVLPGGNAGDLLDVNHEEQIPVVPEQ